MLQIPKNYLFDKPMSGKNFRDLHFPYIHIYLAKQKACEMKLMVLHDGYTLIDDVVINSLWQYEGMAHNSFVMFNQLFEIKLMHSH